MKKKMTWDEFERLFGRKDARPDDSMCIGDNDYAIEGADAEGPTFVPDGLEEITDENDE